MAIIITPKDTRNGSAPSDPTQDVVLGEQYFVSNAGTVFIIVQSTAPVNMTLVVNPAKANRPASRGFPAQSVPDVVQAIPAGSLQILGPFGAAYTDSQGQLSLSFDAADGVRVGAIRVA